MGSHLDNMSSSNFIYKIRGSLTCSILAERQRNRGYDIKGVAVEISTNVRGRGRLLRELGFFLIRWSNAIYILIVPLPPIHSLLSIRANDLILTNTWNNFSRVTVLRLSYTLLIRKVAESG